MQRTTIRMTCLGSLLACAVLSACNNGQNGSWRNRTSMDYQRDHMDRSNANSGSSGMNIGRTSNDGSYQNDRYQNDRYRNDRSMDNPSNTNRDRYDRDRSDRPRSTNPNWNDPNRNDPNRNNPNWNDPNRNDPNRNDPNRNNQPGSGSGTNP